MLSISTLALIGLFLVLYFCFTSGERSSSIVEGLTPGLQKISTNYTQSKRQQEIAKRSKELEHQYKAALRTNKTTGYLIPRR